VVSLKTIPSYFGASRGRYPLIKPWVLTTYAAYKILGLIIGTYLSVALFRIIKNGTFDGFLACVSLEEWRTYDEIKSIYNKRYGHISSFNMLMCIAAGRIFKLLEERYGISKHNWELKKVPGGARPPAPRFKLSFNFKPSFAD